MMPVYWSFIGFCVVFPIGGVAGALLALSH